MLQAHILSCPDYEAHTATICQCSCSVSDCELYISAAFRTLTCELAGLPLIVLVLDHLLDIGREAAGLTRAAQVTGKRTLRGYKKVAHSCKLLTGAHRKRQDIIDIQQQVPEEIYLIRVYILRGFAGSHVKPCDKICDYLLNGCSVFMVSVPEPLSPHEHILHRLRIHKVRERIEWIMYSCCFITHNYSPILVFNMSTA